MNGSLGFPLLLMLAIPSFNFEVNERLFTLLRSHEIVNSSKYYEISPSVSVQCSGTCMGNKCCEAYKIEGQTCTIYEDVQTAAGAAKSNVYLDVNAVYKKNEYATTIASPSTTSSNNLPQGYSQYENDDRSIKVVPDETHAANQVELQCQQSDSSATLFIIRNENDTAWLAKTIFDEFSKGGSDSYWIGLIKENNLKWADGTDASDIETKYSKYITEFEQPKGAEKHGYVKADTERKMYFYFDLPNTQKPGYICQVDS